MNSNLRRVLSVALMIAVLAVNLTIPVSAAPITVSYETLLNNTLPGGQGTLFYDTTAGNGTANNGVDSATTKNRAYAPLEVWSNAARASLNMLADEWVRLEATAPEAGYYAVGLTFGCGAPNGADFIIRNESSIVETHLARGTGQQPAYDWQTVTDLGYLYLNQGTNYIYVDNKSADAQVNFKEVTLTKDDTAGATDVVLLKPAESCTEIGGFTVEYTAGYNQIDVAGTDLTFPVTIVEDGKYQVSVRGIAAAANTVNADFGGDAVSATVENTEYADSTLGTFPLTAGDYTLTLTGLTDYKLAWVTVDYVAPYETQIVSQSITDGSTVTRGTDSFEIIFNDNMNDVAEGQVTLTHATGTIPVVTSVTDATVTVSFLETLDYETPYTLTLTGLQGVNDAVELADIVCNFTTDDETNTDGTATVEVTDVTTSRENGTVTGIVKGSTGVGIKGRTVSVLDSTSGEVATGLSGDNGEFTLDFTITETVVGAYTYTVNSEYGATNTATVTYISAAEEIRILGLFESATTASDVAAILSTNADVLGVPSYATDIAALSNADFFHNHFIGQTFAQVSDLAPFYEGALLAETLNQSVSTTTIMPILTTQAQLDKVGFSATVVEKLALLTQNDKSSFASDLVVSNRSGASATAAAFYQRFESVLDNWFLTENNITGTTLDITGYTTSLNYGGEISIPLKLNAAQKMVSGIQVTVTTADANVLANAQAVIGDALSSSVSVSGNTATFDIRYNYVADKQYTNLGRLALQGSVIGSHTFTVDATVIYRIEKTVNRETKTAEIAILTPGSSFTAVVGTIPQDTERPTGGGGYVAPPKEVEPEDEDSQKSVYFFDDMADALWAQDMVHTLVGKGVISQNAERAFRPMDNVTREEYVKMLITVIGAHDPNAVSTLSDAGADHWATSYIATAQKLGIVQGNADGSFGIGTNITRQDMAVMIYRTFAMLGIDLSAGNAAFTDSNEISNYAKDAVSALTKLGIINGMGDNTFAPAANATRAQAAKVIYVMMEVLGV